MGDAYDHADEAGGFGAVPDFGNNDDVVLSPDPVPLPRQASSRRKPAAKPVADGTDELSELAESMEAANRAPRGDFSVTLPSGRLVGFNKPNVKNERNAQGIAGRQRSEPGAGGMSWMEVLCCAMLTFDSSDDESKAPPPMLERLDRWDTKDKQFFVMVFNSMFYLNTDEELIAVREAAKNALSAS